MTNLSSVTYDWGISTIESQAMGDAQKQFRVDALKKALSLPDPGRPDEAWRRIKWSGYTPGIISRIHPSIKTDEACGGILKDSAVDENFESFIGEFSRLDSIRQSLEKERANDVKENKLFALNHALSRDRIFLHADEGEIIADTVQIQLPAPGFGFVFLPQINIHIPRGSSMSVYLEFPDGADEGGLLIGTIRGIVEEEGALKVITLQKEGYASRILLHEDFFLGENGSLEIDHILSGGQLSMHDCRYTLLGRGSSLKVTGLTSARKGQFIGEKYSVEHLAPETKSDIQVKTVLRDRSQTLFSGNIIIPEGSWGSVGFESNKNLILGEECRAESLPELEIIENDVICSHRAATAALSEDDLLYLKSRGIPENTARGLLVSAFYREAVDRMDLGKMGDTLKEKIISHVGSLAGSNYQEVHEWETLRKVLPLM